MRRAAHEKEKYMVQAANSQDDLAELGASYANEWSTLKEARANARRVITAQFNRENRCNLAYSQVIDTKTGECLNDYFA